MMKDQIIEDKFFKEIKIKNYSKENILLFSRELNKNGNTIVPNVLSEKEINKIKNLLIKSSKKKNTLRLATPELEHRIFLELAVHPLFLRLWRECLGGVPICSHYDGNIIPPNSESYLWWHTDHPTMLLDKYKENVVGQTIIMLDDFTEENGATKIVPGSHKKGFSPNNSEASIKEIEISAKTICGEKGSISFTMGGTWHTAGINKTKNPRCSLVIMYVAPHVVRNHDLTRAIYYYKNLPLFVERTLGSSAWVSLPRINAIDKKNIIFRILGKLISIMPLNLLEYLNIQITLRRSQERRKKWGYEGKGSN